MAMGASDLGNLDPSGALAGGAAAASAGASKRRKLHRATLDIDDVLDRLLGVRGRPVTRQGVDLTEDTLKSLCRLASKVFQQQEMLLELEVPLRICGDIHGQYHDLLRIFEHNGFPPESNYLFLGDYVDRGKKSLETICLLFAYKIKFKENFFLLRGNHETPSISRIYGFFDECKKRYSVQIWKTFCDVFNYLPICGIVAERIMCMHGGLSQDMLKEGVDVRKQVLSIARPADVPDSGFLCDVLWSDPQVGGDGFGPNDRGVSVSFGPDVVSAFLEKESMDLVARAHQVVEDGYEFFAERQLLTIFSAPNYCGEFDNAAAVLVVDDGLHCSLKVLKPDPVPTSAK
eukprot:TRINITY_DN2992_c0_g1_i1.p1 TRINITY_DN2992_c0_g1~~TRINITY_DN2992_c0_g1_i1.p1  ORF type:complete len:345 (-),score=74.16 TRINITY_DN2992_c0_g1_i1:81-1115(-)